MSTIDWQQVAEQLNQHLAKARLTSKEVAAKAGVDRKTVDRLRAGQAVRPHTLEWIEQALHLDLAAKPPPAADIAPPDYGGYRKDAVIEYAGEYIGFRRSFDSPDHIIATHLELFWDGEAEALKFSEDQRNRDDSGKAYQYHFSGDVLIPPNLGVMHLVVRSDDGRVRLMSTSMPREDQGTLIMKGFILTLNEITDIGYYPVTSPIFLARAPMRFTSRTGVIQADDERFAWADEILASVEKKFLPFRQ